MADKISIRDIQRRDNTELAIIIRSVLAEFKADKPGTVYYDPTTDDLFTLFSEPQAFYKVVELNGKLVGGSGIYPTAGLLDGCTEIVKLYLLPEARAKGIGRQLIEMCFQIARDAGYRQVYLETLPELSKAVGLYESCGFKYLDGPLGNTGHFGCDLWMVKDL